jgi:hypothetical protein
VVLAAIKVAMYGRQMRHVGKAQEKEKKKKRKEEKKKR